MTFSVVPLPAGVDRTRFDCGNMFLNTYFHKQVTQDIRRRVTNGFVALAEDNSIAGYYTLASSSVTLTDLPTEVAKKLPRYPTVPVARIGRLAIDKTFKGQGLGAALLMDACLRIAKSDVACFAVLVDAKDDAAAAFYRHHGFIALSDMPLVLFLPVASLSGLI